MTVTTEATALLYSSFGDDPDYGELVEMLVAEIPQRITVLCDSFAKGDRSELCRMAHQLKGAAGSYGFADVTPVAARLESAVKSGEPEDLIRESLDELVAICRRMRAGAPS